MKCIRGVCRWLEVTGGTGFNDITAYGKNHSKPRCGDG